MLTHTHALFVTCKHTHKHTHTHAHTHTNTQTQFAKMEVMEQRAAEKEKTAAEKETNIVEGDFQSIIEAFTATLFAAPRQRGNIVGTVKDLQTGKFKDAAGTFATVG